MNIQAILADHFEYYGFKLSEGQIKAWAKDLADIPPNQILDAIRAIQADSSRVRPATPAQIRDRVFGYESVDEAWSSVPKDLKNEEDSFVMTQEARVAWGKTIPLIQDGNIVQAYLAFKEFYAKEIEKAKATKKRPKYSFSLGTDPAKRDEAIKKAYAMGKVSEQLALSYNGGPEFRNELPAPPLDSKHLRLEAPSNLEADEMTEEQKQSRIRDIQNLLKTLDKKNENPF